ncbi:MAG: SRPBCC family protein [Hyphomicrobiales bacterium]|nr:SRPBCC family protein [Hyphomicrobiales bacterium]MDE2115850.1 SRPBCC family protein [Hyphomicrobiales bacterium]
MTNQTESRFVYVTYIKTTPERLWAALTDPEMAAKYWMGARPETQWKLGSAWKLVFPDGKVADSGEITAFEPCKHLALSWRNEWSPEFHAEGLAVCTMDLETVGEAVKLTVTHSINRPNSGLIAAVSGGWPQILSNLKSLIETGAVVLQPRKK